MAIPFLCLVPNRAFADVCSFAPLVKGKLKILHYRFALLVNRVAQTNRQLKLNGSITSAIRLESLDLLRKRRRPLNIAQPLLLPNPQIKRQRRVSRNVYSIVLNRKALN